MSKSMRVLMVEDSESDASLVIRQLTRAGYTINHRRVQTAAEVQAALATQTWDVVISDYEMPGFSGPEALELFKASGLKIPFIVLSGAVGEDTVVTMMKLGAHDYLMKGKLTRLVPAIEREIHEAKLRSEREQVEKNLAHERYLLQILLDNLPDQLYFKDLESRFTRLSKSQAKLLGLSAPGEALNKTDFDFFDEQHARRFFEVEQKILATGKAVINLEEELLLPGGQLAWVNTTKMPLLDSDGNLVGTFGLSSDITERKRTDILIKARMDLLEHARTHSLAEILVETLDVVGEITASPIGFYHFVDGDQINLTLQAWSTRTMQEFCKAEGKGLHYPIDQAGVWVEAVHLQRPVIHNDYAALLHKKGMPKGHAAVTRELVVPIFRNGLVVAILGVGNKPGEYTDQDIQTVNYLADIAWELVIQKRAEESIRASERFLQDIVDALSLNLCVLDEHGKVLMVNRAWREFADNNPPVPPNYCTGMNYLDVCDTAARAGDVDAGLFAAGIRAVLDGRKDHYEREYPCHSPEKHMRWFNARITRFDLNGARRVVVSHLDTTERKQAEENAKESEARYRAVAESAHDAIITATSAGIIAGWNSGAAAIFGWEAGEAINQSLSLILPAEFQMEHLSGMKRVQNGGEPHIMGKTVELKGVRKDGRVFPLELSLAEWQTGQGLFYTAIVRDISRRKQTEESLQLRIAAIEAADNAIVILNSDGKIQWMNQAFTKLTGYKFTELVGKDIDILRSGKHPPAFYTHLWDTVRAGKVWHGELINRRKDGTLYDEEMSLTPVMDSQGKISRYIAIKKDITGRKLAEQALLEEKERFRSLYEDVPVGIYRTTPGGQILAANPALIRMLGYDSFEDLSMLNLEKSGYGEGFSRLDFKTKIAREGHIQGWEIGMKRKDGTTIFVRENAHAFLNADGQVQYYEGTLEDITEIRKSEQQNLRLAVAIENAGETVILSDPSGQIQYANPAFEDLFGISVSEIIGKNMRIFSNAYQDRQAWEAILALPVNGQPWHGDIRTNHANGTGLEIETTISPVLDLNGAVTSLVLVMHNVTLERRIEIQNRQSQKMEAIGHLAAGIAHEINTPTQFIGNNIRFLKNGFEDLARLVDLYEEANQYTNNPAELSRLKEKAAALANEIDLDFLKAEIPAAIEGSLKGIERVTRIVGAMKEFSHPAAHVKVAADINHAIENTLVVSHNVWKYAAEMITELDPDLPLIPCLVDEFNQVVLNLITNAADAIEEAKKMNPDGGKGVITIRTSRSENWVEVKVSDNGIGIPAAIRDRVFDPFFTTKEVGKGTGQGLPISYDVIVNKHGGKISFETQAGKGTTFIVQLPVEPGAAKHG